MLCGGVLALLIWALHLCWHFNFHVLHLLACTVDVLHLWQLQRSLHLVTLVSLHTESLES